MLRKILIWVMMVSLVGCSYNNKLVTNNIVNNGAELNKTAQLPFSIAINGSELSGSKVIAMPGFVTLTVDYGDSLLETIKEKNKKYFKDVFILSDKTKNDHYDYILNVKTNSGGMCGGTSCYLNTQTSVDIKKNANDKKHLLAENFSDQYTWQEPGSAKFLGFVSGLTLCVICPITIPIALNIEGDELSDQVSMSNDRISKRIAEILSTSDLFMRNE